MKFSTFTRIACFVSLVCIYTSCRKTETSVEIPKLITQAPASVTSTTAIVGGYVSSDGGSAVTERGICCSTSHNPEISDIVVLEGKGTGSFQCILSGLEQNTKYFARAYAKNSAGTGYGSEVEFTTEISSGGGMGTVTDIDGNVYKTVKIGSQIWMAENLKVMHFRDGSPIEEIADSAAWVNINKGAYCWYNNDSASYKNLYGALYNWYTVVDSRQLCPEGWHVATDAGWRSLGVILGGDSLAGIQMKSVTCWDDNSNGTNTSGFNGLPGGARGNSGTFLGKGWFAPWWTSTEYGESHAWLRSLLESSDKVDRSPYDKNDGLAVRCVKD